MVGIEGENGLRRSDGTPVPDTALNSTSTNSVQNKVITEALTYSTEEIKIGIWLGEDLYRKVIPYSYTNADNTTTRVDVTSLNIKTLVNARALLTNLEHEPLVQTIYPNATSDNSQGGLWFTKKGAYAGYPDSDLINLHFGSQYSGYSASGHIIIEYTKTTS